MYKWILIAGLFFIVSCTSIYTPRDNYEQVAEYQKLVIIDDTEKTFDGAVLRYQEGIPVINLKGTYYRMGLQYGVLLKDIILENEKNMDALVLGYIETLPGYQKPFVNLILNHMVTGMEKRLPFKYRQELMGISDATGIQYKKMVFIAFGGGLLNGGCSTIVTKVGKRLVHGRNFDFSPAFLGRYPVIVTYEPDNENKYYNPGIVGYPGVFHGMNEKGISVTLNYGDGTYSRISKGLPTGYKIREILAHAGTLDEAGQIIEQYDADEIGWIIVIGSAQENRSVTYDIFKTHKVRYDFIEDDAYQFAVNRIFTKDRCGTSDYSQKYLNFFYGLGRNNLARYDVLNEAYPDTGFESIGQVMDVFGDTDFYGYSDFNLRPQGCTIALERTIQTIVFDWLDRSFYFASAPGFSSLSPILRYNIETGETTLFRESTDEFRSTEVQDFLAWFEDFQLLFFTGQFEKIAEVIEIDTLNLIQFFYVFQVWDRDRAVFSHRALLSRVEYFIKEVPDFAYLYIMKAALLVETDPEKALPVLHHAGTVRITYPYDSLEIYALFINAYEKLNDKKNARRYAKKYYDLVKSHTKEFCPDEKNKANIKKIRKYL